MLRRLLCLTLAGCLMAVGAQAGFSPGLTALEAGHERGQALRLELSGSLEDLQDTPEAVGQIFKDWLDRLSLWLTVDHAAARAAIMLDGRELLSLQEWPAAGGRALALTPPGLAWSGEDPLHQLLGVSARMPGAGRLEAELLEVYQQLSPLGERKRQAAAIKNVGRAAERIDYPLDEAAWQRLYGALRQTAAGLGAPALPEMALEEAGSLSRLLDGEGQDIGMRLRARLRLGGVTRRLSLLAGWKADGGLYLDLRMPAERGRDGLTLRLSATLREGRDERRLGADWVHEWRLEDRRGSARGRLSLSSRDTEAGESITGSIQADSRPWQRQASRLVIRPALTLSNGLLEGSVAVSRSLGGRPALSLMLKPALRLAEPLAQPDLSPVDLMTLDQAALAQAREQALGALFAPLRALTRDLPEDAYWQLLHRLGRQLWTEEEGPPPGGADAAPDNFVVQDIIEEEDP